jgi:hypothetical protein
MTPSSIVLRFLIFFQYLSRLYLIFPLSYQIVKTNGVVMETAWAGAAYNLMLYMLASHVRYSHRSLPAQKIVMHSISFCTCENILNKSA